MQKKLIILLLIPILLIIFLFQNQEKIDNQQEEKINKTENKQEEIIEEIGTGEERIPIRYEPIYEHQIHAYCDQCGKDISGNVQAHFYYSQEKGKDCKSMHYEEVEIYVGEQAIYPD